MSLLKEFRDFAMRGNVVDLAVGVVIGGAFGKIVTSLVNDIIMPAIGSIVSVKFGEWNVGQIHLGNFIQTVVDFLIVAAAIFAMVKLMNSLKRKQEEAPATPPPTPEDIQLLREIRDELRNR